MGGEGHAIKGREAFVRNVVYRKVSSFELSVFRQMVQISKSWPSRIAYLAKVQLPFVVLGYGIISWADAENERFHRKNPNDFINDV